MSDETRRLEEMARSYKPTINIARAPGPMAPAFFLALGWFFLAWAGVALLHQAPALAANNWAAPGVLGLVHLYTLGFLTMTMSGLLYQWIPVVFDRPPVEPVMAWSQGILYSIGVTLLVAGMRGAGAGWMAAGGTVTAAALVWLTWLDARRVLTSPRRPDALTALILAALAGLNLTWLWGLTMAFGFSLGRPAPYYVLGLHISTALVAWVATLVMGVELKLVPMFTMARVEGQRVAGPPVLAWAGLFLFWLAGEVPALLNAAAGLWMLAALWTGRQLWTIGRSGRAPAFDRVLVGVIAGWVLWFLAALALPADPALAVELMFGGALLFILGYQSRILPFIAAVALARRMPGPPQKAFFIARQLGPAQGAVVSTILGTLLVLALGWGVTAGSISAVRLAGALVLLLLAAHIGSLAGAAWAGYRGGRPQTGGRPD
ncbi:MAG: hypothetical protein OWV35_00565 [Firmicutes bacterium]|nr:hypothetical protein [Bacillota bacterium]